MNNAVNWFEIATTDLDRAHKFYSEVFKKELTLLEMPDTKMYMFPGGPDGKGASGAIISAKENAPSSDGTIVYFHCEDCAEEAGRVDNAGGKVVLPKMSIGEFGFIAQFVDTEGNRIGLHSNK